jgi:hypothetical protein
MQLRQAATIVPETNAQHSRRLGGVRGDAGAVA